MSLCAASLETIRANTAWQQQRVAVVQTLDGIILVKGQRSARSAARFWLMRRLAVWTRNPLLAPVPAYGGRRAQNIEVQRLKQLACAGLPVPEVLHQAEDYIALRYLRGESLQHVLTQEPERALTMFEQGLEALGHVHAQGQYLSQAFVRNMMVVDERFWFIDFEDDPLEVLSLQDAQTRDWLAYLLSSVWIANCSREALLTAWQNRFVQLSDLSQAALKDACDRLRWLRHLPKQRKPWGRDIVTLQALGEFLHLWQSNLHRAKGAVKHARHH